MKDDDLFFVFIVVWGVFGVASAVFFYGPFDGGLKRRAWPIVIVGSTLAFAGIVLWQWRDAPTPWFFLALLVPIAWLNLKAGRFCARCGAFELRPVRNPFRSTSSEHCARCGAKLDEPT